VAKKQVTKQRVHRDYREYLLKKLQDEPEFARMYLNEALADDDQRVFLLALKNVLEAYNDNMSAVAREAQLSRQNLYGILSERGNPKLTSVRSVLHVLGLKLAVQPDLSGKPK
jgi:probable addiction module antidote protein